MSGFDEGNVFYSDQHTTFQDDEDRQTRNNAQRKFIDFLRNFRGLPQRGNPDGMLVYRDMLDQDPAPASLSVSLDDIIAHDKELGKAVKEHPGDYLPLLEAAAADVVLSIRAEKQEGDEPERPAIQCMLNSSERERSLRDLSPQLKPAPPRAQSSDVSKLVRVSGIVIAAARPKAKASKLMLHCKSCKNTKFTSVGAGFGGSYIPRVCDLQPPGSIEANCGVDPYVILPDKSVYLDQQTLKLQENPEDVPAGEMPRNMVLLVERTMVQQIVPGTRVTLLGIYSIHNQPMQKGRDRSDNKGAVAIRQTYLHVVGVERSAESTARRPTFSDEETRVFKAFAQCTFPELLEKVREKIAPSIFGSDDIKVAIACLLFGGSPKRLPDGARLRGDVNVLMLGDPSTAKSQLLKFVEKTAPIAVYTSGKGSSAAGLTASVIRDPNGDFYLEGGAMVLADGGVVCIDEFDKMRPEDRVAIHEAMEQQTISIAKAGITTVLNSRTAVLAAANPPSGRYDDMKSAQENIELQSTILSRFDLIFLVKDERTYERDMQIAAHVTAVHKNAYSDARAAEGSEREEGEAFLKRYIEYARAACRPRLSEGAMRMLENEYVRIRQEVHKNADGGVPPIPITVRQLEAIVRLSEALAKMGLQTTASEVHVQEALRLFDVATMDAARSGVNGEARRDLHITPELRKELAAVEERVRNRMPLNAKVSKRALVDELVRNNLSEWAVMRALVGMEQRNEIKQLNEGRSILRVS